MQNVASAVGKTSRAAPHAGGVTSEVGLQTFQTSGGRRAKRADASSRAANRRNAKLVCSAAVAEAIARLAVTRGAGVELGGTRVIPDPEDWF